MTSCIKFIATDMDGTLLSDTNELPCDFFDVFKALDEKNVLFAAASGRQYFTLLNMLEPIKDKVLFIAENGTLVMYQGKELYSVTIPKSEIDSIIDVVRNIEDSHIVLCGKKSAYTETKNEQAQQEIMKYCHQIAFVDDLLDVDDEFIKISVLNLKGTEEHVYPFVAPLFAATHQVVVSGETWLDFMDKQASKGQAIKAMRNKFGFTFENSMSFGDFFNDVEMLNETYFSHAMSNAHPEIKELARFIAPSNNEQGVITVIKQKVLQCN
ncbi:HAD family hydrolase [Photobacterium kishitanii]|uniref:HAD family hydrolase n=1 Tax=Photobacterium kishitanii TaxID=318456 RepID=A0AAX0YYI9_9GAMM|nr:Cof-type HAD-IIB family hydrolase [Photobacterium kishitanii]KJG59036.1 HAD family hydrolase [Photobacterium kishitanii]KJG62040.1 HAD family hydrolase [Photobacterium kishitanii]KJG67228.1 HAD family hydrolase [Photobacterium kishitanii]KJG70526.1 HAD family hydrolase [Photobacterium kishitanii]PSW61925.1 HAD family hydrolase [Photobacterium kishitanii]